MPKSHTLATSTASPSSPVTRVTMMFSGFRSRCTTPISCATASADSTWDINCTMRGSARGVSWPMTTARLRPSAYSMAMYSSPSPSSPKSIMRTECGWSSRDAAWASIWNRSTYWRSLARSRCRIFRATRRSRAICRARYTAPIPPIASRCSTAYFPAMVCPTRVAASFSIRCPIAPVYQRGGRRRFQAVQQRPGLGIVRIQLQGPAQRGQRLGGPAAAEREDRLQRVAGDQVGRRAPARRRPAAAASSVRPCTSRQRARSRAACASCSGAAASTCSASSGCPTASCRRARCSRAAAATSGWPA